MVRHHFRIGLSAIGDHRANAASQCTALGSSADKHSRGALHDLRAVGCLATKGSTHGGREDPRGYNVRVGQEELFFDRRMIYRCSPANIVRWYHELEVQC